MIDRLPYAWKRARQSAWTGLVCATYVLSVIAGAVHPLFHLEGHGVAVEACQQSVAFQDADGHHHGHEAAPCVVCATLSRTVALSSVPALPPAVESRSVAASPNRIPPHCIPANAAAPRGPPVPV